ncbi:MULTISPECIES: cyclic di-GMP phosphodiesterase [unclassified Bacillus (in: firmicutes)]|uniref:cyclic di-GMP phosphodiesterase n=1 Tax=unclassified Bacillus (in: firmicutes) TaxID=185979 RepID=UPI002282E844|nr:cyclic di-GMP phosphodiesterase [Bacillus sp. S20C3]MCY8204695.1 cyclic di-GMP phosphodiesterase [Bacillus sp. N12A5]MCY8288915.1 cyclic di-GMP phosphodiesterase [Bacillus sp. N13C7]MCY8638180.1 cyclic di-GMP phosphodiesterase [Bacillus sp. S17B2]MCY8719512.1 cyclic di-GMP phosphodiesterase [Bacillus sp. S10C12M]MCY9142076.1 cyclic di-GMP phosphodiesterase [Bacillus sp. T9C1]
MRVFVARQPIFNRKEQVVAYELLYRESEENVYSAKDGDQATTDLVINSFLNIGIEKLTEGKRCFVNFTESLMFSNLPTSFNPKQLVIEILEDIPITPALISRCKELKKMGYMLALDDFYAINPQNEDLLEKLMSYIDILKIDFLKTTRMERRKILQTYGCSGLIFLAEKVETRKEYKQAAQDGFHLFQGYFFSEPRIISGHDLSTHFYSYYELLNELSKEQPNIKRVTEYIERDLSLSYQILKFLNSSHSRLSQKIESIQQAIMLLGFNEIKRWIYILSFKDLSRKGNSSKHEIIKISLMRAKLCELLARKTARPQPASYMLIGMFSLIDTLLHREIEEIIQELPLIDEVGQALLGHQNDYYQMLELVKLIESNNWDTCTELGKELDKEEAYECYLEALEWCHKLMDAK